MANQNIPQNFYLAGLSTDVSNITIATFPPVQVTNNFLDYSVNAICRMKLSVAQNMFQFWAASSELSANSLQDLAFRTIYDASSGWNSIDASATPMSLDFTLGTIVTWVDPSSSYNTDTYNLLGSTYQSLLPQEYLRYLAYQIFGNANATNTFTNGSAVMNSFNSKCNSALNNTLKSLSASTNIPATGSSSNSTKTYDYNNYYVDPNTFIHNTSGPTVAKEINAASQVFQQIRSNNKYRIETMNPSTYKIADAPGVNPRDASGAWYKMPFINGDSIYFVLTVHDPNGQMQSDGSTPLLDVPRKYRIRMFIDDDTTLGSSQPAQISDGVNDITYGTFTVNSKVAVGYSYADTPSASIDPADVKVPGP